MEEWRIRLSTLRIIKILLVAEIAATPESEARNLAARDASNRGLLKNDVHLISEAFHARCHSETQHQPLPLCMTGTED